MKSRNYFQFKNETTEDSTNRGYSSRNNNLLKKLDKIQVKSIDYKSDNFYD